MTHFWLNDREVHTAEPRGMLVLDFLRRDRKLMGTKEGCREGDCGACAVLVGQKQGDSGDSIDYRSVTSCLMPLGELQGKHLVTIEGLNLEGLSTVQQAVVDEGATQCGFCTPGIIVSLTGHLMRPGADTSLDGIKEALGGHLCRCTGYRSLKAVTNHLSARASTGVDALVENGELPGYFREMPGRLAAIEERQRLSSRGGDGQADRLLVAGGTDIYVQRGDVVPQADVEVLNLLPGMSGIRRTSGYLRLGAATTFEDFANHPDVVAMVPDVKAYMFLVASLQIRNRATLGGNIMNASPIGDMTVLLMALDAVLVLASGTQRRTVAMTSFYLGYKEMDRRPGEVLEEILVPLPPEGTTVNWEKVSKRKCLDIASVNSAARIRVDGSTIIDATLTMGGVAPVPLHLRETSRYLAGKEISSVTAAGAVRIVQEEIAPISDVRGSAEYKRLLARQLTIAHFSRMFPDRCKTEVLNEAH